MSDEIKVPVSAPGATQAATDIDKATQAARNLLAQKIAARKGVEDFNKAIEAETKALGKTTPALAKAREEMRAYSALQRAGRTGAANRVFSGGGEGGEHERLFGRGGFLQHLTHGASRIGGEGGELIHRLSAVAGSAGLALGGVTGAAVILGFTLHRLKEVEEKRMQEVEEESKTRVELNRTLRETNMGRQDSAKGLYQSERAAKRFLIASTTGPEQADALFKRLNATGDEGAYGAAQRFLGTKQGHRIGINGGLDAADKLYASGAYGYSEALDALGQSKGVINEDRINRMIARKLGYKTNQTVAQGERGFDTQGWDTVSGRAATNNSRYDAGHGTGRIDEELRAAAEARMRDAGNPALVGASAHRELEKAVNPAAYALEEFKKKLDESLEPLQARADAENQILAAYRDNPVFAGLFGTESEQTKVDRTRRRNANATR